MMNLLSAISFRGNRLRVFNRIVNHGLRWVALVFVLTAVNADAMPLAPHLLKGTVQSVDEAKHLIVLASTDKELPAIFIVKEDRTRLRRDGKPVSLGQLEVGQAVRVYYKKELGEWVATEVSWKTTPPPKPKPSFPINPFGPK